MVPASASAGFVESIGENTVHGSDGPDTAKEEIAFFFNDDEIVG
ncbi:MAG: nucleoside-diphosphate kinase [Pseudomonadota bacterium]